MKVSLAKSVISLLLFPFLLVNSVLMISGEKDVIREITRPAEFDYVTWTLQALSLKGSQLSIDIVQYLDAIQQQNAVYEYINLVGEKDHLSAKIATIFADPSIQDPTQTAASELAEQRTLQKQLDHLGPVVESILQIQISHVLNQLDLATAGQPLPPVLFHVTPLPLALILSPRNAIEEKYNISLLPDVPMDEIVRIENKVETQTGLSALVVPVGGIGVYPTMVMSTTDLPWLVEVICHEWTHNYLTVRPLGLNYETNAALRTMNETTANIAGKEISAAMLRVFYPALVPPPTSPSSENTSQNPMPAPEEFNFRTEMHVTRVEVDKLLSSGLINEAEQYMEIRRQIFWNHGYLIRRLNQAYFAFYGAYADVPGGEAGTDPVGPAVTSLRGQSPSLKAFLQQISKMTDFSQLEQAIQKSP